MAAKSPFLLYLIPGQESSPFSEEGAFPCHLLPVLLVSIDPRHHTINYLQEYRNIPDSAPKVIKLMIRTKEQNCSKYLFKFNVQETVLACKSYSLQRSFSNVFLFLFCSGDTYLCVRWRPITWRQSSVGRRGKHTANALLKAATNIHEFPLC